MNSKKYIGMDIHKEAIVMTLMGLSRRLLIADLNPRRGKRIRTACARSAQVIAPAERRQT
jgi:hypothetical protein